MGQIDGQIDVVWALGVGLEAATAALASWKEGTSLQMCLHREITERVGGGHLTKEDRRTSGGTVGKVLEVESTACAKASGCL